MTVSTGAPLSLSACSIACSDQHLDGPTLFVEPIELGADRSRLLRSGAGQHSDAEVRLPDAASGVDAWPERKTQITAARRPDQPRRFGKRVHPDVLAACHNLQA